MEKKLNIGNVVLTVVAVLLIGLFGFIIYNDNRLQSHSAVEVRTDPAYEQLITENMEKIQKVINKEGINLKNKYKDLPVVGGLKFVKK